MMPPMDGSRSHETTVVGVFLPDHVDDLSLPLSLIAPPGLCILMNGGIDACSLGYGLDVGCPRAALAAFPFLFLT